MASREFSDDLDGFLSGFSPLETIIAHHHGLALLF
jgi:hypothetical protein